MPSPTENFDWDHQIELWQEAFNNGAYTEAEGYGRRILEMAEQRHMDDLHRAAGLMCIAESIRPQKRYAEAEPLYRQALAIREKALPAIHVRTAYALQGLGFTLAGLNRQAEAEPYYLRAIAIWDHVSEEEHESCRHGAALDGLGRVYLASRDYAKAEPVLTRALAVWIKGQEKCVAIINAVNDLAKLYSAQGKLERSENMYRQMIPLLQQELGNERPEMVADERGRLAAVYMAEKKWAEALPLWQQLTAFLQRAGSNKRELLLQSLTNQVIVLRELHRDGDIPAVQQQIEAIEGIRSQSTDPRERWKAAMGRARLAPDRKQRLELLQQALAEAEILGTSPELSETLEILATSSVGEREDLEESYLQQAVSVNESLYGGKSRQVAQDLDMLAILSMGQKKDGDAEAYLRRAVAILEKIDAPPIQITNTEAHLGDLYARQEKYAEAESVLLKSLQAAEAAPQNKDLLAIPALERLGRVCKDANELDKAAAYYIRLVKYKESRSSLDTSLSSDLRTLSDLLRKLNRPAEALVYDAKRVEIEQQMAKTASVTK